MTDITIVNSMVCDQRSDGELIAAIPAGPLSIVASLEKAGYDVEFIDYQLYRINNKPSIKSFSNFLFTIDTKIIGINLFNSTLPTVLGSLKDYKQKKPDVKIILGGPSATDSPVEILSNFPGDIVVCGEGEITIVELMRVIENGKDLSTVNGIVWRKEDGTIVTNPQRERVRDLDSLPLPAYNHINFSDYGNILSIITARGCPYRCKFCSARSVWQDKVTYRTPENILAEFESLGSNDIKEVIFYDDTFVLKNDRVKKIITNMKKVGFDVPWRCNGRIDRVDTDLVKFMVDNGCCEMLVGLESGSDKILKIIDKKFSSQQAMNSIRLLSQYVPRLDVSFIWGYPFETMEDLYDTLGALGEVSSLESNMFIHGHLLCAFPQSPLYKEYGHLASFSLDLYPTQRAFMPTERLSNFPELVEMIKAYPRIMAGFYYYEHPDLKKKKELIDKIWPDVEGR